MAKETSINILHAKTEGQKEYLQVLRENKIVFCLGPAGSGKGHIATWFGLEQLLQDKFKRIIITRPLVQAGESTGFLPGTILEKMDPFVRPVLEEITDYTSKKQLNEFLKNGTVEVIPFAVMRGYTFKHSYIIVDEASNATHEQLKLVLTRFGQGSKMVILGDPQQSDLPQRLRGAAEQYAQVLSALPEVAYVKLTHGDIVREPLVGDILRILDKIS